MDRKVTFHWRFLDSEVEENGLLEILKMTIMLVLRSKISILMLKDFAVEEHVSSKSLALKILLVLRFRGSAVEYNVLLEIVDLSIMLVLRF